MSIPHFQLRILFDQVIEVKAVLNLEKLRVP